MDTGDGHFKMIDELEAKNLTSTDYPLGIFKVGEELTIKGSRFRIKSVKLRELRLKLLERAQ